MARLTWDAEGTRLYETGVDRCVLYVKDGASYGTGVAWNGITSVSESPSGAEANPFYADNIKYLNLLSVEEFGASIEAYNFPKEFLPCDGQTGPMDGFVIGQQARKMFGLCYRTKIGSDSDGNAHGYKIHIIYGCYAAATERAYQTKSDSPEPLTYSWEISTTPITYTANGVTMTTASLVIDSTKVNNATKMAALEKALYGGTGASENPYLPTPAQIVALLT